MRRPRQILVLALAAMLAATIAGYMFTGGDAETATGARGGQGGAPVDLRPFRAAQELAALAGTPREQRFAREARRLADYEVDQALVAALREAKSRPISLTLEIRRINARIFATQERRDDLQKRIAQINESLPRATGVQKRILEGDLQLAKAQLQLSLDEIGDAELDLSRAGGNPQARIRRMMQRHEDAEHREAAGAVAPAAPVNPVASQSEGPSEGLIARLNEWFAIYQKKQSLQEARQAAETNGSALSQKHDELEPRITAQRQTPRETAQARTPEEVAALIASTRALAEGREALAQYRNRADNQRELATVYANWIDIAGARQQAVLRDIFFAVGIVLMILLAALALSAGVERALLRASLDPRRRHTLRTIARVVLQVAVVILLLLAAFGRPNDVATLLGLAGAGLTIALKDFVVGFFGWFRLMGRNGIRPGDWVEIKGVSGEVVEIGLFYTVLLETGNWADAGHPTGRRVTFVNSFAIEGHYFNFSTSGQWLWDELLVVVPRDRDPYAVAEEIQKLVANETDASAKQAEHEWQRVARSKGLSGFTATPAFNLRPARDGIEVIVRYICHAHERHQLRSRLYQEVVRLLGRQPIAVEQNGVMVGSGPARTSDP